MHAKIEEYLEASGSISNYFKFQLLTDPNQILVENRHSARESNRAQLQRYLEFPLTYNTISIAKQGSDLNRTVTRADIVQLEAGLGDEQRNSSNNRC